MAMSARCRSSLGNWVEGLTSATAGFTGWGGTSVLAGDFFPSHIKTVGTGISTVSATGLGISGWSSVCGPFGASTTCRITGGCSAVLPPDGSERLTECGRGGSISLLARCIWASRVCRSRCRTAYCSARDVALTLGAERIPKATSPTTAQCTRIEATKVYGRWFSSGRSENSVIIGGDLMTGRNPSLAPSGHYCNGGCVANNLSLAER